MVEEGRIRIEVERAVNLITALGWSKVEERVDDDTITITFKKKITGVGGE